MPDTFLSFTSWYSQFLRVGAGLVCLCVQQAFKRPAGTIQQLKAFWGSHGTGLNCCCYCVSSCWKSWKAFSMMPFWHWMEHAALDTIDFSFLWLLASGCVGALRGCRADVFSEIEIAACVDHMICNAWQILPDCEAMPCSNSEMLSPLCFPFCL